MGSLFQFNDTLEFTTEQGFPAELSLEAHLRKPFTVADFEGRRFAFHEKPGLRVYHSKGTRVFLVHNIDGNWLHWGKVHILNQTQDAETDTTSGVFKIVDIFEPDYMRAKNQHEVREYKRYWDADVEALFERIRGTT